MKTTKITALLLAATFIAASCNKDDGGSLSSTTETTFTNSIDQSRLVSISPNTSVWTRSDDTTYAGDIAEISKPDVPADAVDITANIENSWDFYSASGTEALYVPASKSYETYIGYYWDGSNVYVEGDLTLHDGSWGGVATIYVLEGGCLTIPADFTLSNTTIYSWGEIVFGGNFTLNSNATIYSYNSENALDLKGSTIQLNSSFETIGSITADKIEIVGASATEATRTVKFGGCVSTETLDISNYAEVYLSAAGVVADVIDLHSYSNIYLTGGTLIQVADELNFENQSCFSNTSSDYAVIDVSNGVISIDENSFLARINGGPVDLNYDESTLIDDISGTEVEWAANVVFNQDTYVAENGCHTGNGDSSTENDPKEPVLEHDATVTSPDDERISATSIDFNNGLLFVSWHQAEEEYQGYIDVVNMTSMQIAATLHTYDYDFNHMYINNGIAYVTGGCKKGAFFSDVQYSTGASSVSVNIQLVGGASGNCITIYGDNKWIVSGSNGGVTIATPSSNDDDEDDSDDQKYTELEEAKFVEPYNGGMAVLAGISSTYIYEYSLDGTFEKSYSVGSISPVDGKNTLHEDGSTIYACLSTGGLVAYSGGEKLNSLSSDLIGSVNCVDTDDNYIYIANGTKGLTIIDKSTWTEVKNYKLGNASANYVKLGDDGYIYVAYGLKGVHRLRLVESNI